jgi:hypothetical protein
MNDMPPGFRSKRRRRRRGSSSLPSTQGVSWAVPLVRMLAPYARSESLLRVGEKKLLAAPVVWAMGNGRDPSTGHIKKLMQQVDLCV